jgi:ribonuclease PH
MRPVKISANFVSTAEGSVLIEVGKTRVVCTASVEAGVPAFLKGSGKGWVTGEYGMLPRSTTVRTPRESARGRQAGRTLEIQRLIGRSLRAVTDLDALGERTIIVDCDVLEADGGTRTASITGGFVALALAARRLASQGILPPRLIQDYVAAISVGIVQDEVCLDLAYDEDSSAQVDMNVVMTGSGRLVEVQATAEGRSFSQAEMNAMLQMAETGIRELIAIQRAIVPLAASPGFSHSGSVR